MGHERMLGLGYEDVPDAVQREVFVLSKHHVKTFISSMSHARLLRAWAFAPV
jgi:hypothetical protein